MKDVIADKIAALIASGLLKVGDELPGERDLASALSVSRETVRAAIQGLAARGVLDVSQGARTRVASPDLGNMAIGITNRLNVDSYDVDAVHQARLLIEQQVVGDAAERISDEALKRLHSSLGAQRACLRDPLRFLICDREFHVTVYRACANPLLADIVTDLYTYMMDHRRRAVSLPGAIAASVSDHEAILAALSARDRAAAMAAFAGHENRIYTTTCTLIGDREPPPR
ncbi:FadR family transcriptional regulator (plasmid) [Paroceanicella profunda]|uniref:FadR family transcriptional regulator n=1 Tax=Paroceanicella profunda TaxID=2579971 RepID=A0A5B8G355_9RHOB|nr:FCD domain-containing protein [Paroceanicella profunda]QDL94534.1 FadR family transcriptional regulator [Paroceanicella profunda]